MTRTTFSIGLPNLLGNALNVDRCFFVTYDASRNFVYAAQDWHRSDLPSIAGPYRYADVAPVVEELFKDGTAVVSDVRTQLSPEVAAEEEKYQHRATLAVPLYDNNELVAALFAVMSDGPRDWTTDEVAIVEQVAVLTRTSVESARLREREHRIATRLQDALQRALPERVPGLRLAQFYRPGLDEAAVGGDFADCFSSDKGLTYLIVGDLSGKGLAAAAQVAIVRNMLRFALYNDSNLARSINTLNRTLADNNMILGFATLFVGCFDSSDHTLSYVNCAQEPGLLRRQSGVIDLLPPTGSVLGTLSDAEFTERVVKIEPGDCLAVFTDGLTEAGPVRSQLLGIEWSYRPHVVNP